MSGLNTFVHSEFFFYGLIVLFFIVLVIFGIVVYLECRKLKIVQAKENAKKLENQKKLEKFAPSPVKEKEENKELEQVIQPKIEAMIQKEKTIKKEEVKPKKTNSEDIERLLNRMQEDLKTKEEEDLERYEMEQEEQAIISYEELIRTAKKEKEMDMDVDSKTPISNRELERQIQLLRQKEEKQQKKEMEKKSGFQTTKFISPVYGIQEETPKKSTPLKVKLENFQEDFKFDDEVFQEPVIPEQFSHTLEETMVEEHHDDVNKNVEFLDSLKEFRKNLE